MGVEAGVKSGDRAEAGVGAEAGAETGRIVVSADGLQIVFDFCIVVCVVPAW